MPLTTLEERVFARLDARLSRNVGPPLVVALSGGGDSVALLALASAWAARRGRRVLALTVDHGLQADSGAWTRRAGEQAHDLGCDWSALAWTGPRLGTGLPAAARRGRHALLARAAREAGAVAILMAHTADDRAEADVMRDAGTPIGRLREWAPSPVWPEGRGVMLLRPLLEESRADLRNLLRARGLDWIEDPANQDLRFARARARKHLSGMAAGERRDPEEALAHQAQVRTPVSPRSAGVLDVPRGVDARTLAAVLTCAGGRERPPRGDRVAALEARLTKGEDFEAVLGGARMSAQGPRAVVHREPGEQARSGLAPLPLEPGVPAVWDGRFEITVEQAGWTVFPARGGLAALGPQDRARLAALPAPARGAAPVLIRDGDPRPVLAERGARVVDLVAARLAAALDQTTHEDELISARMAPDPVTAYFA